MPIYSDKDKNSKLGLTDKAILLDGFLIALFIFALRERDNEYDGFFFSWMVFLNCYLLEYVNKDITVKMQMQTSLLHLTSTKHVQKM